MPETAASRRRVIVLGADEMACAIAETFSTDDRFGVAVAFPDYEALRPAEARGLETIELRGVLRDSLAGALRGADAVVCGDYGARLSGVVETAVAAGCHYVDIAEDPAVRRDAAGLDGSGACIVPACGLAPGYVTALAGEMLAGCGPEARLSVRVGVLPVRRTNRLGYGRMWSIDGLIAEYTAPCLSIEDGMLAVHPPLREPEALELAGERFEAFTTAGSLDGLMKHFAGRVARLDFKTLRYPGHLDYMQFLLDDLGLSARLDQLRSLLMNGLPKVEEDRVIISLRLDPGDGGPAGHTLKTIAARRAGGRTRSAVSIATAAHACSVVDVLCSGLAPHGGFLDHAELPPSLLRRSPFFASLAEETSSA